MIRLTLLLTVWAGLAATAVAQPIIVLIGGNHSDPSPAQLAGTTGRGGNSGLWRLKGDLLKNEQWDAEYFNWNGTRAGHIGDPEPGGAAVIATWIREQHAQRPDAPVILVGNSWGGHTAWQVCRLLANETATESSAGSAAPAGAAEQPAIPVELVVFLDPSSLGRSKEPMPTALPKNVARAVNYYTHNSFGWVGWIDEARLTNVDLGDPAEGFLVSGGPRYDSRFDVRAHVAAEWDERVHAAIRKQIVEQAGSSAGE